MAWEYPLLLLQIVNHAKKKKIETNYQTEIALKEGSHFVLT